MQTFEKELMHCYFTIASRENYNSYKSIEAVQQQCETDSNNQNYSVIFWVFCLSR